MGPRGKKKSWQTERDLAENRRKRKNSIGFGIMERGNSGCVWPCDMAKESVWPYTHWGLWSNDDDDMSWVALFQLSANCWLSVDQVSIKRSINQLSVDQASFRCWSRVLINTRLQMSLTHMIPFLWNFSCNPIRVSYHSPPLNVSGRNWIQKNCA